MKPIRQLARRKGFDLQSLSHRYNGRDAVSVARPSHWGNPFSVTTKFKPGTRVGGHYIAVSSAQEAVLTFREMMQQRPDFVEEAKRDLAGKNLACWCRLGEPCHADVLLEIANSGDAE